MYEVTHTCTPVTTKKSDESPMTVKMYGPLPNSSQMRLRFLGVVLGVVPAGAPPLSSSTSATDNEVGASDWSTLVMGVVLGARSGVVLGEWPGDRSGDGDGMPADSRRGD